MDPWNLIVSVLWTVHRAANMSNARSIVGQRPGNGTLERRADHRPAESCSSALPGPEGPLPIMNSLAIERILNSQCQNSENADRLRDKECLPNNRTPLLGVTRQ